MSEQLGPYALNEVHCVDCLEAMRQLPDNSVDAVVTDPPYGSGGFKESQKQYAKGQGKRSDILSADRDAGESWFIADNMTTAGTVWLLRQLSVQSHRTLVPGGSLVVFCDWRMVVHMAPALESSGLSWKALVVWNKAAPALGRGFRPAHELAIHLTKGVGKYYAKDVANVITVGREREGLHYTQKPIKLMSPIIRLTTPEGGIVVDPLAGSGSTLVAAKRLGRRFLGFEIEPKYVEIPRRRLAQEELFSSEGA